MAVSSETRRRLALIVGLRGLMMLIGGLYAVIFPGVALTVVVIVAGAMLLVGGVIGLWALTFGGARTSNFWFDVLRNGLSIIAGVLIVVSPVMATILSVAVVVTIIAIQAIIVGAVEIWIVVKERAHYQRIWPAVTSGVLYVLFGVVLLIWPVSAAGVLVTFAGIILAVIGVGLLGVAWRLNKGQ